MSTIRKEERERMRDWCRFGHPGYGFILTLLDALEALEATLSRERKCVQAERDALRKALQPVAGLLWQTPRAADPNSFEGGEVVNVPTVYCRRALTALDAKEKS